MFSSLCHHTNCEPTKQRERQRTVIWASEMRWQPILPFPAVMDSSLRYAFRWSWHHWYSFASSENLGGTPSSLQQGVRLQRGAGVALLELAEHHIPLLLGQLLGCIAAAA